MVSWAQIVAFSTAFLDAGGVGEKKDGGEGQGSEETGEIATYRVNGLLPVIVWDKEANGGVGARKVVPMRWGFPDPRDWRRPRPIHGRAETLDAKEPFRTPFRDGQRGIVVFRTFNEGEEVTTPSGKTATRQWTIDPRDGRPRGFAFVWRRFELADVPAPLLACVMMTVPANDLIQRAIKPGEDDPRMPAILEDEDWPVWLGEEDPTPADAKAVLKTMEGVNWTTAPEPKGTRPRKP
jgi:putative SOS response-associated peptidase YedK